MSLKRLAVPSQDQCALAVEHARTSAKTCAKDVCFGRQRTEVVSGGLDRHASAMEAKGPQRLLALQALISWKSLTSHRLSCVRARARSNATVLQRATAQQQPGRASREQKDQAAEDSLTHGELGLREREGVPQMQHAVHVWIGKGHEVLVLLLIGGAGLGSILLETLLLRPPLLRDLLQLDELVAARGRAPTLCHVAHSTSRVGFVDRDERIVFFFDLADCF